MLTVFRLGKLRPFWAGYVFLFDKKPLASYPSDTGFRILLTCLLFRRTDPALLEIANFGVWEYQHSLARVGSHHGDVTPCYRTDLLLDSDTIPAYWA